MRLFLYGTLLAARTNATARALHGALGPGTMAWTPGLLHAIPDPDGWYPALVPVPADRGVVVHGVLHRTTAAFDATMLANVDAYEDFDPQAPATSTYLRRALAVTPLGQTTPVKAQAYCYNRPLPPAAVPIPAGDFIRWLTDRGEPGFGEMG